MIGVRMDPTLRGRIDASDVIQETYVEVAERLPRYLEQQEMPFFLWVRFLTGQKLLQIHRRHVDAGMRDVRCEISLQQGGIAGASSMTLASAILDGGASPSQVAMHEEERASLVQALADLSDVDREILAMRHFERLSLAETAQLLGISESAASRRHVRALGRLQQHMRRLIPPSTR
jgi:RNA polymerase sigma-70 factor (ECF subfamily)